MTTTTTEAPSLPALVEALHHAEAARAIAARHVAEAEAARRQRADDAEHDARLEAVAAEGRAIHSGFTMPLRPELEPDAEEEAARVALATAERDRAAALAGLAGAAPAVREILARLRELEVVMTAARTDAAGADDTAREAEARAIAASTGPDADATDAEASRAAAALRAARRRVAAVEAERDALARELTATAPALLSAVASVASSLIEAAETRFRTAVAKAEQAQGEAAWVANAARHHLAPAIAQLRLPASFMPRDLRPGVGPGVGQREPTPPKGADGLAELVVLARELGAMTRPA